MAEEKYKIEKFNGTNYGFWKMQMEDILYQKDLYHPISGTKPESIKQADWDILDRKALGTVRLSLAPSVASNIAKEKTCFLFLVCSSIVCVCLWAWTFESPTQNPIICDFRLAVQVGFPLLQGTPEYADTAFVGEPATTLSDIYSFGVLIMICIAEKEASRGKKHMMNMFAGQHIKYAYDYASTDKSKLKDLIDKRLSKTGLQKSQEDIVKLARNCTSTFPRNRPTMKAKIKGLFK
ncbi:salt tolerance receptor-like cytoplasmic kinase 1 [Rhododendron vialii]|uniref:salt tolerance receptor-like cytoplasmic kinase 1 n=1 Tax=Rhododendron vialii TaxID=182163 RepID=UPI00265F7B4B|nr:salt tolerance receptor-like cytoplasmic kinase 1 [Rhododendron vialii]